MPGKKTEKKQADKKAGADTAEKRGRLRQIGEAYRLTKRYDRRIGLRLLGIFLVIGAPLGFAGYVFLNPVIGVALGILTGLIGVMIVFGRRVERAAYAQVEGQPGAAAAGLQMLRRGWDVKPGHRLHQEPGRRAPCRRATRDRPGR